MSEDPDADAVITPLGFHGCTKDDLMHFAPFVDLNAEGVAEIWEELSCLDDPEALFFQGGFDLKMEQTMRLKVLSCSY